MNMFSMLQFFFSIVIFMAVQAWDPSRFKKKKKKLR